MSIEARLELALKLVVEAEKIIMPFYQSNLEINIKDNGTEVTKADRDTEKFLRAELIKSFPQDGIIGEEFPDENLEGEYTWTIDPIDGTASFVRGNPFFGIMLGLMKGDDVILGVIHMPALDEIIYAQKGMGCFWQRGKREDFVQCHVSKTPKLEDATVSITSKNYFDVTGNEELYFKLLYNSKDLKTWGDCYGFIMVATGRVDAMIEPTLNLWDVVPVKILIEEAGGFWTSLSGDPSIHEKSALAMNSENLLKSVL